MAETVKSSVISSTIWKTTNGTVFSSQEAAEEAQTIIDVRRALEPTVKIICTDGAGLSYIWKLFYHHGPATADYQPRGIKPSKFKIEIPERLVAKYRKTVWSC